MISETLITELQILSRAEKLKVVQLLINQLASEEEKLLVAGTQYEIWSPFDAAGAAQTLTALLDEDKNFQHD
jgi:hypothetical protein